MKRGVYNLVELCYIAEFVDLEIKCDISPWQASLDLKH